MEKEKMKSKMILQVHDEILIEAAKEEEEKLKQAKLDEKMAGPIYDITDLIKNQMGRR